jgi:hypothetical protein
MPAFVAGIHTCVGSAGIGVDRERDSRYKCGRDDA